MLFGGMQHRSSYRRGAEGLIDVVIHLSTS
jgi:hypothetical protein